MSEKANDSSRRSTSRNISRRRFLEIAGAGLGVIAATNARIGNVQAKETGANPESTQEKEEFKGNLSFALIKGVNGGAAPVETINRIEEALGAEKVDAILTPEFSFFPEGVKGHAIQLLEREGKYVIDPLSDPEYAGYLSKLQELAKTHSTTIFAATFKERTYQQIQMDPFVQTVDNDTMLHINEKGEIVGIKRGDAPKGNWNISRDGKDYRVLPIICQEIAARSNFNEHDERGFYKSIGPKWVEDDFSGDKKADLMIHPQRMADVRLDIWADVRQGIPNEEVDLRGADGMDFTRRGYDAYYQDYIDKSLKSGAPIITADYKIGAAFASDGKPLNKYSNSKNYTTASISR